MDKCALLALLALLARPSRHCGTAAPRRRVSTAPRPSVLPMVCMELAEHVDQSSKLESSIDAPMMSQTTISDHGYWNRK